MSVPRSERQQIAFLKRQAELEVQRKREEEEAKIRAEKKAAREEEKRLKKEAKEQRRREREARRAAKKAAAGQPTASALRKQLRRLVAEADLEKATTKTLRKQLEEHFGVSLQERKKEVTTIITQLISERVTGRATEDKPLKRKGGFNKAYQPSAKLASFVGSDEPLSRPEATKFICSYVKKHELQNPDDRRQILLDAKLQKVFGIDSFTYFSLQKHLSDHLIGPDGQTRSAAKANGAGGKSAKKTTTKAKGKRATAKKKRKKTTKKKAGRKRKRASSSDDEEDTKKSRVSGFASQKLELSTALQAVCGGEISLSRGSTVKKVWEYVREHGLQDPSDRRFILCDSKLKKVMGGEARILGFGMSKYLGEHLTKV